MYSLYYSPFACSLAIHSALEKIGQPYRLIKVDIYKAEHLQSAFLARNPQAQVPLLEYEGGSLTQVSAILLFLAEQHPQAHIMPRQGSAQRGPALQSLLYLSNTVHPLFLRLFYPQRISKEAPADVTQTALVQLKTVLDEYNELFAQQEYCVANTLFAPDYYLFAMLNWLRLFEIDDTHLTHLNAFRTRMKRHLEVSTVLAKEMKSMAA